MTSDELTDIFKQYAYFVERRCALLLTNPADAADVTHEVFLRVEKYASGLTGPVTLSYLYSIAERCCYDWVHRNKRYVSTPMSELERIGGTRTPDERVMIRQVIRSLDRVTAHIAVLHHVDGYTQEEIAAQTGYSRRTIGLKLSRFADSFKEAWSKLTELREEIE